MRLMINGEPAEIGKTYTNFRGESMKLLSITKPHKPSSTGRIYVEEADGSRHEFFPGVIDGVWEGRTDQ